MKILVCGGRDYKDRAYLYAYLDSLNKQHQYSISHLIHGCAKGADQLGAMWACDRCIPIQAFPADWEKYGTKAGPMRNGEMLAIGKPDMVIAFPGGKGTADMIAKTRAAKITLIRPLATDYP